MTGLAVLLEHPDVPTCADCKLWLYKDGELLKHLNKPIPRPLNSPLPCHKCPKSPDSKPNPGADMRGRGARAYELYLLIKSGMPMPEDAIVRRNCLLIEMVLQRLRLRGQESLDTMLSLLVSTRSKR